MDNQHRWNKGEGGRASISDYKQGRRGDGNVLRGSNRKKSA